MRAEKAGVRAIAVFEAAKGLLVLLTAGALLQLVHGDAQRAAENLVRHFHLNPARHYPRIFIDAATNVTNKRLLLLAAGALAYAVVRLVEAYGLWRSRNWARLFGIISAGLYVPFEVAEIIRHPTRTRVLILLVNLIILFILWRARFGHGGEPKGAEAGTA